MTEKPPQFPARRRISSRLLLGALGLATCTLLVNWINVDNSVSATVRGWDLPGDVAKAIDLSEVFGHSVGAAGILVAALLLAPTRRSGVWVAVVITLTSGLTANLMKTMFVRVRPHSVGTIQLADSPPGNAVTPDAAPPAELRPIEGSAQAAPQLVPSSFWDSRQRSFPSGHSATAWGLALGLSLVFPRGVALFVVVAALASLQRLTSGAHFPTDVLAGAAIAFATTSLLLWLPPLQKLLAQARSASQENLV